MLGLKYLTTDLLSPITLISRMGEIIPSQEPWIIDEWRKAECYCKEWNQATGNFHITLTHSHELLDYDCGFHAAKQFPFDAGVQLSHSIELYLVEAAGRIELHTRGFRSEYMRILVKLSLSEMNYNEHRHTHQTYL